MKKSALIIVIVLQALYTFCFSQNIITIKEKHMPYFLNKTEGQANTYKIIEPYRTAYLELMADSSFLFYNITPSSFNLSRGKYSVSKPLIRLNWDSVSTYKFTHDSVACAKLFRFKKPIPYKPLQTVYKIKEKGIESVTLKYDKIELLFTSDIHKKGPVLDSFTSIQYTTFHQKKIVIKCVSKNDLVFNKDSIWGFKIYKDGGYKVFQRDPIPLKWNMFPGIQIAQIEKDIVIYMVENSTKTFYYYFSKKLDSEVFLLNKDNLTKEFNENTCFTDSVTQYFKWSLNYGAVDERTHNFKVVDMYKSCTEPKEILKPKEIKVQETH